ncbi:helix-turn-helix domain-containing protein [Streptomyces sp. DH1]|uniref:helix-turn-helix domain-containing protein n=1 Tax=Streptomyces sp. DH1 TaxID=2857012 RepID=UPI001E61FE18|nr:helix-turn-helix domain-containing protein [Streptomyces sp. DH1]
MIPRNRPVINEVDIAQQAGVPIATWRRRDAPAFRRRVTSLFPHSRILIYDRAEATAYLAGRPLPELPAGEHPDDLLSDQEAAAELGITASTVRAYATQGYIPPGTTVYSLRLWTRRDITERRDNPPGQGLGGGRPPGSGTGPRKAHPYEGDPRLHTAAEALQAIPEVSRHSIAASLAQQHGGSTRTWERLLVQVQSQPPGPG